MPIGKSRRHSIFLVDWRTPRLGLGKFGRHSIFPKRHPREPRLWKPPLAGRLGRGGAWLRLGDARTWATGHAYATRAYI